MHLYISSFRRWILFWLLAVSVLISSFLIATELIIRIDVEPKDLFEQSIGVFFNSRTDSAFFGDSIVAAGVIPEGSGFVNLATGGEPPVMMLQKIKMFFSDKARGRAVLPANINMLSRQLDSFADYDEIFSHHGRGLVRSWNRRHRAYSLKYWQTFLFGSFESKRTTLPDGGEIFTNKQDNLRFAKMTEADRIANAKGKVADILNEGRLRSAANKRIFREMLDFLQRKGVAVCLAVYPMSKELRDEAKGSSLPEDFRSFFRDEAAVRGMRYVDLWNQYDDPAMFIDATHMSEAGARRFTPIVTKRCFG